MKLTDAQRAQYTERLRRGRAQAADTIPRRPAHAAARTVPSHGQEQLWFLDRFAPGLPTYNIPQTLRLSGRLDAAALGRALDALVARHEPLRTRFVADPQGRPVQQIDEPVAVALREIDLSDLEADERDERLARLAAEDALEPFALDEGYLLRTRLVRLAAAEHVLILVVHHIVFDGASLGVLTRELAALYDAETTGGPAALEPLPIQFADYALWERERCRGPALDRLVEYWRSTMAGFETLQLPTDRPRPPLDGFDGGVEQLNLGTETLAGIRALARRESVTPFVVLLAALAALLARYTGQDDVVVGAASANRGRPELEPLIGYLVNLVPVRVDLSQDPDFGEVLRRVREASVGAFAHQDLPFGRLVEVLGVPRDPSRAPVFQVALSYADLPETAPFRGLTARVEQIELPAAKFDLDFFARELADGLRVELSYSAALFDRATARRMLRHLAVLTAGAVADPALRVSQLPVLAPEELDRELVRWNDTAREPWPGCVHERFEQWAAGTPAAVAAELGSEQITYAGLNEQANRIARWLRDLGVGPEVLVGVAMAPSLRRLAVLLGILKAGGGYVPLDPALPAGRLSYMMHDTGMPIVLADDEGAAALPETAARVIPVELEWPRISDYDAHDPLFPVQPSNAAYVIYTSGSTGRPKGVVVEHANVLNLALQMVEHWSLGPADRVLQLSSLNFDASVLDWVGALLTGARAVVVPSRTRLNPSALAQLLREHEVSFALIQPAVLSLLTGEHFPHLKRLAVGGEQFPPELANAWLRPGLRLFNLYGPTECTVVATFAELDDAHLPPPIGLPVANTRAYVLDPHLRPVPAGVVGELHLGGSSVSRGYLNAPEPTRERFVPDPFAGKPGARMYRTGDLVRRLPDGNIVFCGRRDGQVKIRGLRIELGEIEAGLLAHRDVAQAAVLVVTDPAGQQQLAGYVRPAGGTVELDAASLREHLSRLLPGYMVPTHIHVVEEFPLNSSGKVDRSALPALDSAASQERDGHRAPSTVIETVLTDLYTQLLRRERVGADEGFFDLGGTSLQAMQLVARLRDDLAVDVDVTDVFLAPDPGALAAVMRDKHGLADAALGAEAFGADALGGLSDEATAALVSSLDLRRGRADPGGNGSADVAARRRAPTLLVKLAGDEREQRPPLFTVHAIGGAVHPYAPLAALLTDDFTVYGVQAAGLAPGSTPAVSLDTMAAAYLAAIRSAQPEGGPYRLAGWSMGALVAYELARRLEEDGEKVSALILLDAPFAVPALAGATPSAPGSEIADSEAAGSEAADSRIAAWFVADAARTLGRTGEPPDAPDPAASSAAEQLNWLARLLDAGQGTPGAATGLADAVRTEIDRRFSVFQAHTRLIAGFRPQTALRTRTLLISARHSLNTAAGPQWLGLLGPQAATLRTVEADHYSFLRPPLVTQVAAEIRAWQGAR